MPDVQDPDAVQAKGDTIKVLLKFIDNDNKTRNGYFFSLDKSAVDDETLSDLRSNIAGISGSIELSHLPFCDAKGFIFPDSCLIKDYAAYGFNADLTVATTFDICMKQDKSGDDSAPSVGSVIEAEKLARLKGQVGDTAFKQITGTAAKYIPELEERDWAVVTEGNNLCYGIRVIRQKIGSVAVTVGVETARYPAFRIKKRNIMSDTITTSTLRDVELNLRIPEYTIDDKSFVSIYETETSAQLSMATSAFSQVDVAAAGGGSFFGCSASASASYGQSSSAKAATSTETKTKKLTITYNFPRCTVYLDETTLELTPECQKALSKIVDGPSLSKFLDSYGEFFSRKVQLGGRLFATEDITSTAASGSQDTANEMKAAAAASFSGFGYQASLSVSANQSSTGSASQSTGAASKFLTWQANGGDTLLCNDPKEWAPTVSYHWNWRTTQKNEVCHIVDLIGGFNGYSALPARFGGYEVTKSLGISPQKHKRFTLNSSKYENGRFLVTTKPAVTDLSYPIKNINSALKAAIPLNPAVFNRGAAFLGPKEATRESSQLIYQAETEAGIAADIIKYGTAYYVKHVATDLWLDYWDTEIYNPLFGSATKFATVKFIDPAKPDNQAEIPNKGVCTLQCSWKGKQSVVSAPVINKTDAFVVASTGKETTPPVPLRFIIKY